MGCSPSSISVDFETRTQYDEARYLENERRNLDKYFHRLSDKLRHRNTSEEVIHVRDVVEKSIRLILESVAIVSKNFHWKKDAIMKVGSFYEGTQITGSNRFDYIAVLDEFTPEVVSLDVDNKYQGYLPVRVVLKDGCDAMFSKKWKNVLNGSNFIGCRSVKHNRHGLLDRFIKHLRKVCSLFTPRNTKFGTLSVASDNPVVQRDSLAVLKFVLTKTIEEQRGSKLVEESTSRDIFVTITPAIKWGDAGDYIYRQDVHFERLYDVIVKSGMFLVVPSLDGYFKVAFTATESSMLANMSQRHKRALCVIKFLIKGDKSYYEDGDVSKYSFFDSISINMMMLALEETCPCNRGQLDYDLYECVIHVLKVIHAGLHNHDASYNDDWEYSFEDMFVEGSDTNNNDNDSEDDECEEDDKETELGDTKVKENSESDNTVSVMQEQETETEIPSEDNRNDDGDKSTDDQMAQHDGNESNDDSYATEKEHISEHNGTEEYVPLEYDILRLLSARMRMKVNETSLYMNCASFHELMKHDLKYWIGQCERYNFWPAIPNYGVTCLTEKLKKNTVL